MDRGFDYAQINSKTWDSWVEGGIEWGVPVSHEEYLRAQKDDWQLFLTPMKPVPREWFLPLNGAKLLGLASGGGQQMPILTARGAICTVFDYSDRQLASEQLVADREGYEINIVKGDMTKRLPFEDESFDMIFHPVSNCYVEDVCHVWRECARLLRKGGVLLAGMDNGITYLFNDTDNLIVENKLPYNPLKDPALLEKSLRNNDGVQFSHLLEEQLGGQLKAGLCLTDIYDDYDRPGWGRLRDYAPTYIMSRAVKP